MPKTLEGVVLLGFMERNEAINYLREHCWFDPQLTEQEAAAIWERYRNAVDALPERTIQAPTRLPIPAAVRATVDDFLRRTGGPEVMGVLNIDPSSLVVYQLYVAVDRANEHARAIDGNAWARSCLVVDRPIAQMPLINDNGVVKVQLPHGEHMFSLCPDGAFRIQQGGGFVCVCEVQGRLVLKAGYHRSFAFSRFRRNEPEAKDKSLLVALTRTVPAQLLPEFPTQGLRTTVLGCKPPLFSDFFDESLAMTVKLRKKKYELHIKVDLVQVDES